MHPTRTKRDGCAHPLLSSTPREGGRRANGVRRALVPDPRIAFGTRRRTAEGWRLHKVDDIKDLGLFVNGKRIAK